MQEYPGPNGSFGDSFHCPKDLPVSKACEFQSPASIFPELAVSLTADLAASEVRLACVFLAAAKTAETFGDEASQLQLGRKAFALFRRARLRLMQLPGKERDSVLGGLLDDEIQQLQACGCLLAMSRRR